MSVIRDEFKKVVERLESEEARNLAHKMTGISKSMLYKLGAREVDNSTICTIDKLHELFFGKRENDRNTDNREKTTEKA